MLEWLEIGQISSLLRLKVALSNEKGVANFWPLNLGFTVYNSIDSVLIV